MLEIRKRLEKQRHTVGRYVLVFACDGGAGFAGGENEDLVDGVDLKGS